MTMYIPDLVLGIHEKDLTMEAKLVFSLLLSRMKNGVGQVPKAEDIDSLANILGIRNRTLADAIKELIKFDLVQGRSDDQNIFVLNPLFAALEEVGGKDAHASAR